MVYTHFNGFSSLGQDAARVARVRDVDFALGLVDEDHVRRATNRVEHELLVGLLLGVLLALVPFAQNIQNCWLFWGLRPSQIAKLVLAAVRPQLVVDFEEGLPQPFPLALPVENIFARREDLLVMIRAVDSDLSPSVPVEYAEERLVLVSTELALGDVGVFLKAQAVRLVVRSHWALLVFEASPICTGSHLSLTGSLGVCEASE